MDKALELVTVKGSLANGVIKTLRKEFYITNVGDKLQVFGYFLLEKKKWGWRLVKFVDIKEARRQYLSKAYSSCVEISSTSRDKKE